MTLSRAGTPATARLLAVTAVPPWPARDGYSLRAGRLLEELAHRWPVTVLSPAPEEIPEENPGAVDWRPVEGVPATNMLPWREERGRLTDAVRSELANRSYRGAVLWNGAEYVAGEIEEFPVAVADRIDCEALQAWRKTIRRSGIRHRLQEVRRGLELALYERRELRRVAAIVATGPDDAAALARLTGRERVEVVPNGVEIPPLDELPDEEDVPTVIFTGVLSYSPNIEAARWFTEAVWPGVRGLVPNARFLLAGRSPDEQITALARRSGVKVRSDVPDMAREIRRAWMSVAPMRSGSGIKNKVLEAWAVERPAVLTELATNGLDLDRGSGPGELICSSAEEMVDTVTSLLRDHERRRRLGRQSRAFARERHSWARAGEKLAAVLTGAGLGQPDTGHLGDGGGGHPPSTAHRAT